MWLVDRVGQHLHSGRPLLILREVIAKELARAGAGREVTANLIPFGLNFRRCKPFNKDPSGQLLFGVRYRHHHVATIDVLAWIFAGVRDRSDVPFIFRLAAILGRLGDIAGVERNARGRTLGENGFARGKLWVRIAFRIVQEVGALFVIHALEQGQCVNRRLAIEHIALTVLAQNVATVGIGP